MPIYLEPISYSGERITAAIALQGIDGTAKAINTLPLNVLNKAFGSIAEQLIMLSSMITDDVKAHLLSGGKLESWQPMLSGIYCGNIMESVDTDMESIINQARLTFSSLSALHFEQTPTEKDPNNRITDQVKRIIVQRLPDQAKNFNRPFPLKSGYNLSINYAGKYLAANFCNLKSKTLTSNINNGKSKLFDLLDLRDSQDAFGQEFTTYELIAITSTEKLNKSEDYIIKANMNHLIEFADKHKLSAINLNTVDNAVKRLVKQERLTL